MAKSSAKQLQSSWLDHVAVTKYIHFVLETEPDACTTAKFTYLTR